MDAKLLATLRMSKQPMMPLQRYDLKLIQFIAAFAINISWQENAIPAIISCMVINKANVKVQIGALQAFHSVASNANLRAQSLMSVLC